MKFSFDREKEGYTFITRDTRYLEGEGKACGFLTEQNRHDKKELGIAELNDGMEPAFWCRDEKLYHIVQNENGCTTDWTGAGQMPLTFVQEVSGGNYKITVSLYSEREEEALVFLGRRRLIFCGTLQAGEKKEVCGLVNVCPVIPRTYTDAMEDKTVDVTVFGKGVFLSAVTIEPWNGATVYIAGDSTVTDQSAEYPYYPHNSYAGWGQMLSAYLGEQMAVSNHAHSGLTTESFRTEGHYAILAECIKPGDICLFQFGHNDQKLMELTAYGGYRDRLLAYIKEIQKKGAIPVLVSPLARNSWMGNGAYNDLLKEYAAACSDIAKEQQIPFLDLHKRSMELVISCGRDDAKRYFFPSDYTHSNDYGAYLFAGYVYEELIRAGLFERTAYQPWIPAVPFPKVVIPEEYADKKNPADNHLFSDLDRPEDFLTRAEALEMVIQTMRFFPTNVYNDMFTDVIGHETYAGSVECAWQNGLIPEFMIKDRCFFPQQEITGEEFFAVLLNGYRSRKTVKEQEIRRLRQKTPQGNHIKRKAAAAICRQMQI